MLFVIRDASNVGAGEADVKPEVPKISWPLVTSRVKKLNWA